MTALLNSGLGSSHPLADILHGYPTTLWRVSPLHIPFPLLGVPFLQPSELLHNPQDPVQTHLSELIPDPEEECRLLLFWDSSVLVSVLRCRSS